MRYVSTSPFMQQLGATDSSARKAGESVAIGLRHADLGIG